MNYAETVGNEFRKLYDRPPMIVRSPGRVNLIGEHTDYNLGFVMPAAIDKAMYFAAAARTDQRCTLHALDLNDHFDFAIGHLQYTDKRWPNYLMGVVAQLIKGGYGIRGFDCVFSGDIPIGAGLSSSAAMEAGLAFVLNRMFDLKIDNLSLVKLAQRAENEFVGVQCGIMDQYANIFGEPDSVLRLDCRSLESRFYPFGFDDVSIVLLDTGVSHSLAASEYNRRREECAEGVARIRTRYPGVEYLRDVNVTMMEECREQMPGTIYRRCRYVVDENARVLRACMELENKQLKRFGALMDDTHHGLRDLYEVSCAELDFLVETVRPNRHVYGSRMMGGGFGGCTVNLIENAGIDRVIGTAAEKYKRRLTLN